MIFHEDVVARKLFLNPFLLGAKPEKSEKNVDFSKKKKYARILDPPMEGFEPV